MVARRVFSREFQEDAVKRSKEPGVVLKDLAFELDINSSVLHRWIREYDSGHWDTHIPYARRKKNNQVTSLPRPDPPPKPQKPPADIEALQQQIVKLTQERDALKQTLAFYINNSLKES